MTAWIECRVTSRPADNFFVVEDGEARDLGNTRPKQLKGLTDEQRNLYAFVTEEGAGGKNRVARFRASSTTDARARARNRVERQKIERAILGRATGRREDGKIVFEDMVIFGFVEDSVEAIAKPDHRGPPMPPGRKKKKKKRNKKDVTPITVDEAHKLIPSHGIVVASCGCTVVSCRCRRGSENIIRVDRPCERCANADQAE